MSKPSNNNHGVDTMPEPAEQAKQYSAQLCRKIAQRCEQNGGYIPFREFMSMALYEPGLGYYSGGLQKFGAAGDFITAPEVSSLFSQCLAGQVADVIKHYESPTVLEFGAGSGVMAADILLELEHLNQLPERYLVVELSAELKQRQQETINTKASHLLEIVTWLDELPVEPFDGVVVANEVLDAMPVECFRIAGSNVEMLKVHCEDEVPGAVYEAADENVTNAVRTIEKRLSETRTTPLPDSYCSEYNPSIKPWLDSIYKILNQGVVLLIDYGYTVDEYYHQERTTGTMMCHYQHRAHPDPLWYPGLQDITAFVDFTDVAYSAAEAGFGISGFTTQAAFLMSTGLDELHQRYISDDVVQQVKLSQQIKTLTLPSEMGERFKVMGLTKNYDEPLRGFILQDFRNRL